MPVRRVVLLGIALVGCSNFIRMQPPARVSRPAVEAAAAPPNRGIHAWWIGHATVLVEMADRWILTDPNFSPRVGLLAKRFIAPGIDLDALPEIDWVLISHAHLDHLDVPSLARVGESARVAAPPGAVRYLPPKVPFREVTAPSTWQTVERDGVRVTAVPARHGDGRFGLDALYDKHSHTGWVVEYAGLTLFFAGDTGYDSRAFKEIGSRFAIDLALVPVGPAGPRLFRAFTHRVHASPDEAMQIFADLRARWMVPIHHGTFFTGGAAELAQITSAIARHPLAGRVLLLRPGEDASVAPALSAL